MVVKFQRLVLNLVAGNSQIVRTVKIERLVVVAVLVELNLGRPF